MELTERLEEKERQYNELVSLTAQEKGYLAMQIEEKDRKAIEEKKKLIELGNQLQSAKQKSGDSGTKEEMNL